MALGILGKKLGMTQIFTPEGLSIPVTVVQAGPCTVTQIKTQSTDGYAAVQVGFAPTAPKHLNKPEQGHLAKAGVMELLRHLKEFRVEQPEQFQLGQTLTVEMFQAGQQVDVAGTSIGRGFAGYQKRHNFARGPMSHGSKNHRLPGSTGAGTTPGRVFPGKRMAGRYGASRVTTRKLTIIRVDQERGLLLIKGSVPGVEGGLLEITPAKTVGRVGKGK
ncbi:MAG: 50S ribosomal protein L3 [Cyanobacteriota bacterium]|nr:50S ribosomal protein L3 [Cyanobacteriota bacterium]